jgi:alkanesulfonate monooxygenase SsuD/methylene tetrahydromethanopterin reductase-like flavin-dependent oxidoreductase (luciferase family)
MKSWSDRELRPHQAKPSPSEASVDEVTIRLGLQIPNFSYDEGKRPTFSGKYYRTESAMAEPRFRDHIPLMIGGSGEKKTIPLAARHFDHLNVIAGFDELARKVEVKNRVCEELGRDPATLETSMLVTVMVDENATPDVIPDEMKQGMVVGSADAVAEQLKAKVFDAGVDGVIMNLPTSIQWYQPGHITALGEALKPLVSA